MRTNTENLELFADLLVPATKIFSDQEVTKAFGSTSSVAETVRLVIKRYPEEVIEILACLEGVKPSEYVVPPPLGLFAKVLNFANSPEVQELFTLQGQKGTEELSGSATENTKDGVL